MVTVGTTTQIGGELVAYVGRNHPQQIAVRGALDEVDDRTTPEASAELIVMLLPANRTEQGWWQDTIEPYRDGRHLHGPRTEFWRGRTRFIKHGATEIKPNERPPFGCVLVIWGS